MAFVKTCTVDPEVKDSSFLHASGERQDSVICKSPDKLQALISRLQPGVILDYVSDGDWSMHDLVMQLIKIYRPADLFLSTYALREYPIRQIILAQERGDLRSVRMILDYRARVRTPEVFQLAALNANAIFLTNIHAKVTVLRSPVGCVSIVGSANWTQNPRIEAGTISLSEARAAFHINWMEKVMEHAEIFG